MRRLGLAVGSLALLVAACSEAPISVSADESLADVISSAPKGSVVQIEPGRHAGPIVLDRPIELVGVPGAFIIAPFEGPALRIESDDVTVRDLVVEGGRDGVHVIDSINVLLDRVDVRGSQWHGILVDDSHVVVTQCRVSGLLEPLSQGFEIRNADGRPSSRVEGCRIEGPVYEGLVSHVSHVTFVDNHVSGSSELGINITEMSNGRMQGNTVTDAEGAAYFCGDMSHCSVVGNVAEDIGVSEPAHTSGGGHGLVVHYHSRAFVDGLVANDLMGEPVLVMLDSELVGESLYP